MLEDIKHQLMGIYDNCRELTGRQILGDATDVFLAHTKILNKMAALDVDDHQVDLLMADASLKPAIENA